MSYYQLQLTRYFELEGTLEDHSDIHGVLDDATYNPPHRPPGLSPYDAVVTFDVDLTSSEFEEFLDDHGVTFDRVTGVSDNDSRLPGEYIAFVSLVDYSSHAP